MPTTPPPRSTSRELQRRLELEAKVANTGTENQRARFDDNLLPEDELLSLARTQYFAEFSFPRWAGRDRYGMQDRFPHAGACEYAKGIPDSVVTKPAKEMQAGPYDVLARVKHAANTTRLRHATELDAIDVEPFEHRLRCPSCGRERVEFSVKVSITWAAHKLVREFALDPERYDRHRITITPTR